MTKQKREWRYILIDGGWYTRRRTAIHLYWRVNHYKGEDSQLEVPLLGALVVVWEVPAVEVVQLVA